MKRKIPFTLLALWIGLAVTPVHFAQTTGAESSTGTIVGRVSNEATGLYLEGVRIALVGTNRVIFTDREGHYRITGLPPGEATLAISYTGLDPSQITATVAAGQVVTHHVALSSDVYALDEFIVAGSREGDALAITQQRNAPNVKNVAATDTFGNIADGNAAEMLRLLPGVAAINDENESRFMMVRGIDANLNNVTFDGMRLASGGSGANRQTGMSEIPLGTVEFMEVTKSPTPDMDGDSIGGSINMRPASVFDRTNPRRITYGLSASSRFGDLPSATSYTKNRVRATGNFGYSNVFGANQNIGVTVNLSHTINWVYAGGMVQGTWEQTDASPAYMRLLRVFDYHSTERRRTGVNLRLDYKVSENSRLYLNSFYTYYNSKQGHEGGRQEVAGLAQVATLDSFGQPIPFQTQFPFGHPNYVPGGFNAAGSRVRASILPGYTDEVTEMVNATYRFYNSPNTAVTKRYSFQPGGRHQFGDLELDYNAIYQESPNQTGEQQGRRDHIRAYQVRVLDTAWRLDGRQTGSFIRRDMVQTGGPDVRDPNNWELSGLNTTVTRRGTDIYGGLFNLTRQFLDAPAPYYLKTGMKFMSETRYTTNPNTALTYTGPQGAFLTSLLKSAEISTSPGGKWYAMESIPTYLDLEKINQLRRDHPEYFVENEATSVQNALANDKTATERVWAGYVMGNVSLGSLSVLGGVRVEKTYVSGESAVQDPQAGIGITDPVEQRRAIWGTRSTVKGDYVNVLPGIHLKYEAGPNWMLRGSWAQTYGRPSFGSIYPDIRFNYNNERITQNNTGLRPQEADNFDVSVEYYFEPVGIISAGLFLKEIDNFIFRHVVTVPPDSEFGGEYAGWELSTLANGGFARVRGMELNYSQQLSFLPRPWSGFGVFGNFTKLETEGNYGRVNEAPSSALVNFTPEVFNAGLSFASGRFTGRVNANHTSPFLRSYNANPVQRSYREARTMVDLKFGYRISRELNVFADVANLFNSKQIWYMADNPNFIHDWRKHGVRIQGGIRGSF